MYYERCREPVLPALSRKSSIRARRMQFSAVNVLSVLNRFLPLCNVPHVSYGGPQTRGATDQSVVSRYSSVFFGRPLMRTAIASMAVAAMVIVVGGCTNSSTP